MDLRASLELEYLSAEKIYDGNYFHFFAKTIKSLLSTEYSPRNCPDTPASELP